MDRMVYMMNKETDLARIILAGGGKCEGNMISHEDRYSLLHPCPYLEEIYDDSTNCTCCPDCVNECMMDI